MDPTKELQQIREELDALKGGTKNKLSMIVFSGDLDKLLAAFIKIGRASCRERV